MTDLDAAMAMLGGPNVRTGLNDLVASQGGVQGLLERLQSHGMGAEADSWVSTGPNQMLSAEQIGSALGSGPVADFAQKLGISPQQAAGIAAILLPIIISQLTPNGRAQEADSNLSQLPGGLGDVLGSVLGQAGGSGTAGGMGDILGSVLGGATGNSRGSSGGGLGGLGSILGGLLGGRK